MGAVITGSNHPIFKERLVPNDVDAIFQSNTRDAIIKRLTKKGYSIENDSVYKDDHRLADLIFVGRIPRKVTVSGIDYVTPEVLRSFYRDSIKDSERKDKGDQFKIDIITDFIDSQKKTDKASGIKPMFHSRRPRFHGSHMSRSRSRSRSRSMSRSRSPAPIRRLF